MTTVRQPMLELSGHTGPIIAADWLTGGNQVITASWDRSANIYDAEKGEIIQTLSGMYVSVGVAGGWEEGVYCAGELREEDE